MLNRGFCFVLVLGGNAYVRNALREREGNFIYCPFGVSGKYFGPVYIQILKMFLSCKPGENKMTYIYFSSLLQVIAIVFKKKKNPAILLIMVMAAQFFELLKLLNCILEVSEWYGM